LLKQIIESFGNEDVSQTRIIDYFSGSGSTFHAAYELNCIQVTGYELNTNQFNGSFKRFKDFVESKVTEETEDIKEPEEEDLPKVDKLCFVCGERNGDFKICDQKDGKNDHSTQSHYIHKSCENKQCPYFVEKKTN